MEGFAPYIPGFLAAYAILLMAASSPGPAVALLIGIGTTQGRAQAMTATAGIASASVLLNLLTLAGVGFLLSQIAWAMTALKLVGAAYLLWLALGAFRKALNPPEISATAVSSQSAWKYFVAGFVLQISNPKAIVFWLAIAAIGATSGGGPFIVAAFVFGAFLISFGCHAAWALLLSSRPIRAVYARIRRWVDATLGGFFVFAACKLATSRT